MLFKLVQSFVLHQFNSLRVAAISLAAETNAWSPLGSDNPSSLKVGDERGRACELDVEI